MDARGRSFSWLPLCAEGIGVKREAMLIEVLEQHSAGGDIAVPIRGAENHRRRLDLSSRLRGADRFIKSLTNLLAQHRSMLQMARTGLRPVPGPQLPLSLFPVARACFSLGERTQPDEPDDERIKDNQRLPQVKMEPLKCDLVPLAEVKKTDDTNQVQTLDRKKTDDETDDLVFKWRRKGEQGSEQDDQRLDTITTALNANTETGRGVTNDVP